MKKIISLSVFFLVLLSSLFAQEQDDSKWMSILSSELQRYEDATLTSLECAEIVVEEKGEFLQFDFVVNGTPLRVISHPDEQSFIKELREVLALHAIDFKDKNDYYIHSKYQNIVTGYGDIRPGDVLYCMSADKKKLSFIADIPVGGEAEKLSLLKPLYNSRVFRGAELEIKKSPVLLDVSYSLGFINQFRHILDVQSKFTFFYPAFLKFGLRADFLTDFSLSFDSLASGLTLGLECMIPLDYIFNSFTSLNFYTEFNALFGFSTQSDSFCYTTDVGIGFLWYISYDLALKFGVRALAIGAEYNFPIPLVQLGCSTIL